MADIAAQPFVNYGLSQAQQAQAQSASGVNNAQAGLTQQQTAAAAMENQIMRTRMPLILSALNNESATSQQQADSSGVSAGAGAPVAPDENERQDTSGANPPGAAQSTAPGAAQGTPSFYQPDQIDQALRRQFYVPQYTPQEMNGLRRAYLVDPKNQYGLGPQTITAQHDMRVADQTQASQLGSRNVFDAMHAVVDSDQGKAMTTLESMYPNVVAKIRKEFAKDPNADVDEDAAARQFAAHVAGAVHQYTGREAVADSAGVYRDKETGMSIPGVEKAGMSAQQWTDLAKYAMTPSIDMPDGAGGTEKVAPWRAAQMQGANVQNPTDYIMQLASHGGVPGAASTLPPGSAQKQVVRKQAQTAVDAHNQSTAGTSAVNGVVYKKPDGSVDDQMTKAMSDPDYDVKIPKYGAGHQPPPEVIDARKELAKQSQGLLKDAGDTINSQRAALVLYRAAQDTLDKGHYDAGAWGQQFAQYARWLPAGAQDALGTGDYQKLSKYLGQAALQSGKGIFQRMTQQEANWLKNELNPSAGMNAGALRDLIDMNVKQSQYVIDSAGRAVKYVGQNPAAPRKNPNDFPQWNQKYYPMQESVRATSLSAPATKPDAGGYIPGRLYPGANGTKARYKGNGQWEPQP